MKAAEIFRVWEFRVVLVVSYKGGYKLPASHLERNVYNPEHFETYVRREFLKVRELFFPKSSDFSETGREEYSW